MPTELTEKTILEQARLQSERAIQELYGQKGLDGKGLATLAKQHKEGVDLLVQHLDPDSRAEKFLDMKELTTAADFRILFPAAVMQILQRSVEPTMYGQRMLTKTINVKDATIMQFPNIGGLREGGPYNDNQEIPETDLGLALNTIELRTRKYGLRVAVSDKVIEKSQWDILGIYLEEMRRAHNRRKEELIWTEFEGKAHVRFNNASTTSGNWTKGLSSSNARNATFDWEDLIDMIASLGANGKSANTIFLHPLMWSVAQKDPVLRFQMIGRGPLGQSFGAYPGADDKGITDADGLVIPFGLTPVVTPFVTMSLDATLSTGVTGHAASHLGSIIVADTSGPSILLLVESPLKMADWADPSRAIRSFQISENYDLGVIDGGRGAVVAQNVRVATNYQPVMTIRNIPVS